MDVVLRLRRLEGLHREVGRRSKADEVGQEAGKDVEEDELASTRCGNSSEHDGVAGIGPALAGTHDCEERDGTDGRVGLGHARRALEVDEVRVLGEL